MVEPAPIPVLPDNLIRAAMASTDPGVALGYAAAGWVAGWQAAMHGPCPGCHGGDFHFSFCPSRPRRTRTPDHVVAHHEDRTYTEIADTKRGEDQ